MPPRRSVELKIELKEGAEPVSKPVYRLSPAEQNELKSQIELLLKKGLIRPSVSPWESTIAVCSEEGWRLADVLGLSCIEQLDRERQMPDSACG